MSLFEEKTHLERKEIHPSARWLLRVLGGRGLGVGVDVEMLGFSPGGFGFPKTHPDFLPLLPILLSAFSLSHTYPVHPPLTNIV
jgi:hypothetical protein